MLTSLGSFGRILVRNVNLGGNDQARVPKI